MIRIHPTRAPRGRIRLATVLLAVSAVLAAGAARGQAADRPDDTEALRKEVEALRKLVQDQQAAFDVREKARDEKLAGLEEQVRILKSVSPIGPPPAAPGAGTAASDEQKKLEEEFARALQGPAPGGAAAPAGASRSGAAKLIDISFDCLNTAGVSTAREAELRTLEFGDHDPHERGVTVQNDELTLAGVVDPYFRGDANIVFHIDDAGETGVELEEAYLTTTALPGGLQVKAGQFFNAFGRLNPQHPHEWQFVDQPVIHSRMFGPDGLRAPGAQISWLTPLPFYAEAIFSAQNSKGETLFSFRNTPGEDFAGRTIVDTEVDSLRDLLYLARLKTSFDLSDEITIVPGLSALFGPNGTGEGRGTQILGLDFYGKWKPLANERGWPFLTLQAEVLKRRYEAAEVPDPTPGLSPTLPEETLRDWGGYAQLVWGFSPGWTLGGRFDVAAGNNDGPDDDPLRDFRRRVSLNVSYFPSEFSKLRLQYNLDDADHLGGTEDSVFLQFEVLWGAHGAHKF